MEIFAALYISSSDADGFAYLMLLKTVSSNNVVFWSTIEISFLNEFKFTSLIFWLSIKISPVSAS